ncbi:hypothetical protein VTI28DRAFT_6295 [Corynascus sepedonium]
MANEIKQYFLAPSWDYPPNGPIALGNIIRSPTRPVPPLLAATSVGRPLISTTKHNVEWTRDKASTHSFGVWTKFVESVGVNLGFEASNATQDVFRFERMCTEEYFPDEAFLAKALASEGVQRQLALAKRRRRGMMGVGRAPVYVIVGVKTVSGAQVRRMKARAGGVQAEVAVDAALMGAAGVPMSVGPAVGVGWEREESMTFEGSDDFVFAYRVRKVWLGGSEKGVRQEDYFRGAMLGLGNREAFQEEVEPESVVLEDLTYDDVGDIWSTSQFLDESGEGEVVVFASSNTSWGGVRSSMPHAFHPESSATHKFNKSYFSYLFRKKDGFVKQGT